MFCFLPWPSWAVIFYAHGNLLSHVSPPDWRHSMGNCSVKSSCTCNEWHHLLWPFYLALKWLPSLENRNKTHCFLPHSKLCRIFTLLTGPGRCSASVDPQNGMHRKSHLALWRSTGWLTPPMPELDERGTSRLSSFSDSCLSTPVSVLTFP